ncbi:MAG: phosphate ABC transporter permease PstA [Nitrospinaceae bacterium]|nr:phosphate ABC transporter permease PstA [Nitrospinaceae bacterium]NIR57492.1 phosphate ABC transporter permease PstA [Nitrospinaceae bacterium]NIS87962.1 phosphate ABC transporter permease PstA [Nitrospinaceae bacterium]NIT84827.1 phosphate ABC transporter permease PstA [Nitrospinaceae bacterium]NIU47007.1 phosphate ABC transporter permease PstA [Nitrospinaceae bacterium]
MNRNQRKRKEAVFLWICRGATWLAVAVLMILLFHVVKQGIDWLDWQFLDSFPSRKPHRAGIKSALWGSLWLVGLTALISIPLGIASAIYLEEYAPKNGWMRIVEINLANLAAMPSILYGLLGLAIFVRYFDLDRSLWAGSMTLSLLVLPVIVIASKGSIRSVPQSIREGAYALGARRWQVVFYQVLPSALPGIMTGIILALSRAMGESAPLIMVGALSYIAFLPEGPSDPFTALPVQIFNWAARPQEDFHGLAAGGIIVLLILLLTLNAGAVFIREKLQRYK